MATQLIPDDRISELIESLGGTPEQRDRAKYDLIAFGSRAVNPLIKAVREAVGHPSWAAAELLGELGDPQALPALVDALLSQNPILGSAAARSLVNFPDWRASDFLTEALPQAHVITQQNIVLSLLQLGEPSCTRTLIEQLARAVSPTLRCVILQALGELGDPAAIPVISPLLKDDDHHVRQWAKTALLHLIPGEIDAQDE